MQETLEDSLLWLRGFAGKVALASTLHEPQQSLLPAISRIAQPLSDIDMKWHFAMTDATRKNGPSPKEFCDILTKYFKVCVDSEQFPNLPREDMIEANHIGALRLALESGKPYICYGDMDRLCLGFNYYPKETIRVLNTALASIENNNLVAVLGRSPHSMNTHLASLVLTEQIFHHFYNLHVRPAWFLDVAGTMYLAPAEELQKVVSAYQGGEFLGARCNFPEPKILLQIVNNSGAGIVPVNTQQMLRYEAPEQMRNDGRLRIAVHEWTPECYDQVTLASRPVQESIMQKPAEWNLRFTTVHQYCDVLQKLWMQPRGIQDTALESTMKEITDFNGKASVDQYRSKAIEMFNRYQ